MINDETVYPGWTRADNIITSLLFAFPIVIKGMFNPLKVLHKFYSLTYYFM